MILNDRAIRKAMKLGDLVIDPFNDHLLKGNTYDMLLSNEIARIDPRVEEMDPYSSEPYTVPDRIPPEGLLIHPGEVLLASSIETFELPTDLVGIVAGKSSWARRFLQVECAGFFDSGWRGTATLELVNIGTRPFRLHPLMPIAQMIFFLGTGVPDRPYGHPDLKSKYQGQIGPTPARHLE